MVPLLLVAGARGQGCPEVADVAVLNGNAMIDTGDDLSPTVAADRSGTWLAAWPSTDDLRGAIGSDRDILFSRSSDHGETWSPPVPLNSNAAVDVGDDSSVELDTDGAGTWLAVWRSSDTLDGTLLAEMSILYAVSTDNGLTWTAPAALNPDASSENGALDAPRLANDGAGQWLVIWGSRDDLGGTIGSDRDLLFVRSLDNAATWSTAAPFNTTASSDGVDEHDGAASLATDGSGRWVATWQYVTQDVGYHLDILYSFSTDNGMTWSQPAMLSTGLSGWNYNVRVATDRQGGWMSAWRGNTAVGGVDSDYDIFFSYSGDGGQSWSLPSVVNANANVDQRDDMFPRIAADGNDNWVMVWFTCGGTCGLPDIDYDAVAAMTLGGQTVWSAPQQLNSQSLSAESADSSPAVATDGLGTWISLWTSRGAFEGTLGTDLDILCTRVTLPDSQDDGDQDGIIDPCDNCALPNPAQRDCQFNGVGDVCDLAGGFSADCNGTGTPDECDVDDGTSEDCGNLNLGHDCCVPHQGPGCTDATIAACVCAVLPSCCEDAWDDLCVLFVEPLDCGQCGYDNGMPDECEPDCNANAVADSCDIGEGTSSDADHDGVPDECACLADVDGDGQVNASDLAILLGVWGWNPDATTDFSGDGWVDSADLAVLLAGWGSC